MTFTPTDLTGCTVWVDATQLGLDDGESLGSEWPNLGSGGEGTVVSSPAPVVKNHAPNGKPVVAFTFNEGRIRGTGMCVEGSYELTVVYVARLVGPNLGRAFTNPYPPYNFLVGLHSSGGESMYDNGWVYQSSGFPTGQPPTPWRIYEAVCTAGPLSVFTIDGVLMGTGVSSAGHASGWNLSGYDLTGNQETCECEVAELICYDRALSGPERIQVQDYLHAKWFEEAAPPAEEADVALGGGGSLSATVHPWESPADTAGLGLWLDASQITGLTDGDAVSTWSDASPVGHHTTAIETPPRYRPAGLNGRPAVDFSAGLRRMNIPGWGTALTGKTNYTLFYVARVASFGYSVVATAPTDTLWRWLIEYEPSGGFYWGHGNGYFRQFAAYLTANTPHTLTFHHTTGGSHYYINGTEITSYYIGGSGDIGATVPNVDGDVTLGGYYEGSYPVDGVIAELIWYDHALTTAERLQVEDYLNEKYFGAPSTPASLTLTGSGALTGVATERYSASPALAGGGTLSATVVKVAPVTAALAGGGTLSATRTVRVLQNATLSAAGSLSATISTSHQRAANLLSTGQLQATVTAVGEELPPPYDGGWTSDTDVGPPPRLQGPSWSPSGSTSTLVKPGGWFALLEKVAPHTGNGNLTTVLAPHYATMLRLYGQGVLSCGVAIRNTRAAVLDGSGLLDALVFPIVIGLDANFTGSGQIATSINDGLSATIQAGYGVSFSGGGALVVDTEGGVSYTDGLSASVVSRYLFPVYFASVGELLAFSGEVSVAMAYLIGSGALTADTPKQIYPLMAALAGNGTLSAGAFAAYQNLVNLLGSGQLSATDFARYLTAAGFAGAGAFTALLLASYDRASSGGGVGTVTALTMQRYVLGGAAPTFDPTDITGCTVWLDAAQLGLDDGDPLGSVWPNLGGGGDGNVVASPAPVVKNNAPNGKPVVRFKQDEGRVRGTGLCVDGSYNLTVLYVGRFWTANASTTGRIFSNTYGSPGYYNFLVGASPGAGEPAMYDNGWVGPTPGFSAGLPSPWRVFEAVCTDTPSIRSEFYADGTLLGFHTTSAGHGGLWNISGYDATGTQETGDCEVAELICYDRALTTTERQQVEDYLTAKWFEEEVPTGPGIPLSGTGNLTFDIEGVINVEEVDADLDGDGALDAEVYGLINQMFTILGSEGALSASAQALYSQIAALSGDGVLSAAAIQRSLRLLGLAAAGALDADTFIRYATAAGLTGAGAFAALAWELEQADMPTGGTGTVSATVTQRYPMAAPFSGGGTLASPEFFDATYPDGLSARVARSYGAPLTGDGVLSGLVRMYQLQITAALSGAGALSATATVVQKDLRSADLSGDGALSATVPKVEFRSADLSGGGALSATAVAQYQAAPVTASDDFNRANSTTSAGPGWTNQRNVVGVVNNASYAATVPNVHCAASFTTPMSSEDMEVSVVLGPMTGATPNSYASIILGANSAGQHFLGFVNNNDIIIYSNNTGWISGPTVRNNTTGVGFTTGDKVTLRRTGNVYQTYKNGSPIAGSTFTDAANLIPADGNHLIVGIGNFNPLSDTPGGRTIDSWEARSLNLLQGGGTLSATAVKGFTPFTEENTARTNQAVPTGCTGCWVTLIGAGGGGGGGARGASGTNRGGGTGGGGAGFVPRVFVPVANLGATYSVAVATSATASGAIKTVNGVGNNGSTGAASTFVSGSTSMSAGGGGAGLGGPITASTQAGGGGGAVTGATGDAGTAGGTSTTGTNGGNGVNNGTSVSGGAGGGGGLGFDITNFSGFPGSGGSTNGQAGGVGNSSAAGSPGSNPVAGIAGSGGGGGAVTAFAGGNAPGYGGGGGGGGSGGSATNSAAGGTGGPGYSKIEWV